MKKIIFLLLLFFLFLFLNYFTFAEVNFSDFERYQKQWTRAEIEEKLALYLEKDQEVRTYFSLNDSSFILYNAPAANPTRVVEYELKLALDKKKQKQESLQRKDLAGIKIAIDPGHLGGSYAALEDRYINIPPTMEKADPIKFDEGTLCYLTAVYLKTLLENERAIVMMTKEQVGQGAYEEEFFDWLKNNPKCWAEELPLKNLFGKYYNPLDIRARAQKINQFSPDLSIVIHYNAHEGEEKDKSSKHTLSLLNYNMVFIPGAFFSNELSDRESRYEFLRLLVSEDFKQSLKLSKAIFGKFSEHLHLHPPSKTDSVPYLTNVCLKIEEGVYARNLALTRLIHGPLCYGETLIQNNIDESARLIKKDFVICGQPCPLRIKQVGEAYFEGIKEYFLQN